MSNVGRVVRAYRCRFAPANSLTTSLNQLLGHSISLGLAGAGATRLSEELPV